MSRSLAIEHEQASRFGAKNDPSALLDLVFIEKAMVAKGGLREFTKLGWHVMQPGQGIRDENGRFWPLWNWHHDALCDIFEEIVNLELLRTVINIPFRHTKSTIGSISTPVYGWIKRPSLQFLNTAYVAELATRDALQSRRVIQSPWFQARWGDRFHLMYDQNRKTRYDNDKGGHRLAQSVGSGSIGEGGDIIGGDDPHNTESVESDDQRRKALRWWDEELATRLNDPMRGALYLIMQRLHHRDLSGHALAQDVGYQHFMLPAEYEEERKCIIEFKRRDGTKFKFKDPRKKEGEPLDKKRFPKKALDDVKGRMTKYAIAGQLQQRPAPRLGGTFEPDLIPVLDAPPAKIGLMVRYWDKAGTKAEQARGRGAWTAGVLLGHITAGTYADHYLVMDVVRGQWEAGKREIAIKNTAERDGLDVVIYVEQEPGSGGKESAQATVRGLAGYEVYAETVSGAKEVRAEPLASQMEIGNVLLLKGHWNEEFIEELRLFPNGSAKDQVDSAAGSFNKIAELLAEEEEDGDETW
jgi:predicted phage terminase large subunit-like protein